MGVWRNVGRIVGPAAVTSLAAGLENSNLTTSITSVPAALSFPTMSFNETDPLDGSEVIDEAASSTTLFVAGNNNPAWFTMTVQIEADVTAVGLLSMDLRINGGTYSNQKVYVAPGAVPVFVFMVKLESGDTVSVLASTDTPSFTAGHFSWNWTRTGGGAGPEGEVGPPPGITASTTAALPPGSNPTASVTGGPNTYNVEFGIPQGIPGSAASGFVQYNELVDTGDSIGDPGGSERLIGDQQLPVPSGTQKPATPFFFEQLVNAVHDRLVGRLDSTGADARPATAGEIFYNSTTDAYEIGYDVQGSPQRFTIPGMEYGTDSSIEDGDATDRPEGTVYFRYE